MAELEQRLAHVSAERQRLRAELLRAERVCDGVRAALRARGVEPVEQREGPTPDVAAEVALRAAAWELAGGSGVDALRPLPDQMRYPWFVQGLEHISNAVAACRADTAQHLPLQQMTPQEQHYARAVLDCVAAFVVFVRERVLAPQDGSGA